MGSTPPGADPAVLKPHLDRLYAAFDKSFLEPDPLAAVADFGGPKDLEAAALFAAMFAYGRADLIQRTVASIVKSMGASPASFLSGFRPADGKEWMAGFKYRFHTQQDLAALALAAGRALNEHGSLLDLFLKSGGAEGETVVDGVSGMAKSLRRLAAKSPGFKTLVTDPADGGASKRWMLYMRWMVRKDGVDPGPWSGRVDTSRLVIPLDTHVGRISRLLGMLARKSNDLKAALELTAYLRLLDPADPVRYDFAICSYGKLGYCSTWAQAEKCAACGLAGVCRMAAMNG